jgi:type IV secretory pathway VirB4 component
MFRNASLQRKTRAFSDYLRYALPLGNGVVRLKGNGYLRSFAYRGPDLTTSSWEELATRSDRFGALLRQLDDQWSIHVDAFRVPAREYPAGGFWPDRLTWLLDQDRRVRYEAEGAHFETRYVMTFAYYPRHGQKKRSIARLLYDSPQLSIGTDDAAEEHFLTVTNDIASAARKSLLSFAPLGRLDTINSLGRPVAYDETLSFLSFCVRGKSMPIALVPDEPMFLDGIIGSDDVRVGWDLRVGEKWVAVMVVEGYPGYSYPGILDALAEQPLEYRFSQRFVPMSKRQADDRLAWLAKGWGLVSLGGVGMLTGGALGGSDSTALRYKQEAQAARDDAKAGMMYGHYLAQIVLHAPTREQRDAAVDHLKASIESVDGFAVRVETENVVEAFLASLPGERDASEYREAKLSVRNVGHLLPLTATWAGPVSHPNPRFPKDAEPLLWTTTRGATPFRFEPHVGGLGHMGIFGTSDGGKSTLLMRLVSAFLARYRGARAFHFDIGYSAYKYALGAGGIHYRIGAEDGPSLAPLTGCRTATGFREALFWLTETYEINRPLQVEQQKEMRTALEALNRLKADISVSDFTMAVQDEALREVFTGYAGSFLDSSEDALDFRAAERRGHIPYHVFEYEDLGVNNARFTQPFVMYVQRRIWEALNDDSDEPSMIIFDEGHKALKMKRMVDFFEDLARTSRKKLGQLVFATQDPMELLNSPAGPAINNLLASKVFLGNPSALTKDNTDVYRALGLTIEEINVLSKMEPYTYLLKNRNGTRVFTLALSDFELAFLAGAGPEDRRRVDHAIEQGYAGWPSRYMRSLQNPNLTPYIAAYENAMLDHDLAMEEQPA